MTRPKNLNTQYGRTYLRWLHNKKKVKKEYARQMALLIPQFTVDEYLQFEKYYFG